MAAPCARLQLVRGPVRKCGRGRPFNTIVRRHMNNVVLKCSFCTATIGKGTGTAGADGFICHSCANQAGDRLEAAPLRESERSAVSPSPDTRCNFCYSNTAENSVLFTQNGHFVCAACIGLIRREIIERELTQTHETVPGIYPL